MKKNQRRPAPTRVVDSDCCFRHHLTRVTPQFLKLLKQQ